MRGVLLVQEAMVDPKDVLMGFLIVLCRSGHGSESLSLEGALFLLCHREL